MRSDTFWDGFLAACCCVFLPVWFCSGMAAHVLGVERGQQIERRLAITAEVGEWTTNKETGEAEFQYIKCGK